MHCPPRGIDAWPTGHGDLQNRSEEIICLGVPDHTLIPFAGPQRIKTQFQWNQLITASKVSATFPLLGHSL
jgi:hypothetical protein